MNLRLLTLPVLIVCLAITSTSAQQTGSFNDTVTFEGQQRAFSCFVSSTYDPNVPVRLVIGLHGAGDSSINYRNALVDALDFEAAMPNTILICPDAGDDVYSDFHFPAGDEAIIEEAITYARSVYMIDTAEIILQGFSLGGRSALRYGLTYPEKFKGLILNTPAIQGVKEANTVFTNGGLYDYAQASELPIYITYGNDDANYVAPIDSAYHHMVMENGMVRLFRFSGGHTIPPFTSMPFLQDFFETPALEVTDLALLKVIHPARVCTDVLPASMLVQNIGSADVTTAKVSMDWGTGTHTQVLPLSLAPFEHAVVTLDPPVAGLSDGDYNLEVSLDSLDQVAMADTIGRYSVSSEFRVETESTSIPFLEDFADEGTLNKWINNPSGDYIQPWSYDEEYGSVTTINTIFSFENIGTQEDLLSPTLNLSAGQEHWLSFDVAYNYSQFTTDVLGIDTVLADTLEVSISTDCGLTFQTLYKKGGTELITFDAPILNPFSASQYLITVTEDDYRKEVIDLSDYAAETQVVVRFSYISGLGGVILLDNIAVGSEGLSIPEMKPTELIVRPNPATDQVFLDVGMAKIRSIQVTDLRGRTIYSKSYVQPGSTAYILTQNWASAVYIIRAATDHGVLIRKLNVLK